MNIIKTRANSQVLKYLCNGKMTFWASKKILYQFILLNWVCGNTKYFFNVLKESNY